MKEPHKSKTLWFAGLLTVLGALDALFGALDVTKLPPDAQKWLVPVIGIVTYLLRRFGSDITPVNFRGGEE